LRFEEEGESLPASALLSLSVRFKTGLDMEKTGGPELTVW